MKDSPADLQEKSRALDDRFQEEEGSFRTGNDLARSGSIGGEDRVVYEACGTCSVKKRGSPKAGCREKKTKKTEPFAALRSLVKDRVFGNTEGGQKGECRGFRTWGG